MTADRTELRRNSDTVVSFDHRPLVPLAEYGRLLRAIDAFAAAEHGLESAAFVEAVRDAAALRTMPSAYPRFTLPLAADVTGEVVTAHYQCTYCGSAWQAQFEQTTDTGDAT